MGCIVVWFLHLFFVLSVMFSRKILSVCLRLFLWTSRVYAFCGDSVIDLGEQCDDGWVSSGDGCDVLCQYEWWYECVSEPSFCTECFAWMYGTGGSCFACPANTYSSFDGQESCDVCPAWSESPPWSFYCDPCGPWSYSEAGSSCTLCAAWTYSVDAWTDVCLLCNPWEGSTTWSISCELCLPWTASNMSGSVCTSCGTGEIASLTGSQTCTSCDPWYEADETHTMCLACSPGRYEDGWVCIPCMAWFISAWTWATECNACGINTFTAYTESSVCVQCPWWSESGTGASECVRCSPWSFGMSWSSCLECAPWRYSSLTWSTECLLCSPWTYSSTWSTECTPCAPNTFTDTTDSAICQSCPAGFESGTGATECAPCGLWTASMTWSSCTACDPWTYAHLTWMPECLSCPDGYTSTTWAMTCTACEVGMYGTWWICTACAPGSYTNTEASSSCVLCEAGRFASSTWSRSCTLCAPWSYATTWASACELCASWTYQDSAGASSCLPCASWWVSGTWATACDFCPSWTYRVGEDCIASPVWGWSASSLTLSPGYFVVSQENEPNEENESWTWNQEEVEEFEQEVLTWTDEIVHQESPLPLYDDELVNAYNRAREHALFEEDAFDNELLYKPMTRGELAKIVSNFARKALHRPYVYDIRCASDLFSDNWLRDQDLRSYVEQACSLSLMWRSNVNWSVMKQFRAYDIVTRAEFATVISRLLYWTKYNGTDWENRYQDHLNVLYKNWFLKQIDAPFVDEILWYVMIVLMRIGEKK